MFLLGMIWNREDFPNLIIKIMLIGVSVWGAVLAMMEAGFIIQQ